MNIAMDYDGTWDRDPDAWKRALIELKKSGAKVYGITMRTPAEASGMDKEYDKICDILFFTSREAKRPFMKRRGISIDIWIDDNPHWVDQSSF